MRSLKDLSSLKGRSALVTGGAGHIGFAIADGLAELGANVILLDRETDRGKALCEELRARWGVGGEYIDADLERADQYADLPSRVESCWGRLDILVNCAAFVGTTNLDGWNEPFERQSLDAWRRALEVNLTAPFAVTQMLLRLLIASGRGSVVNIASIYGMTGPVPSLYEGTGMNNPAAYGASKGGLLQLTRWLATTLAPRVRVNAVTPGGVARGQDERFSSRYRARTPMGRMATEEDIKGAAAFLASDLSAYVTGQNIVADGGWSVW
ncbi:MAG: SDR family oxidoreductase [Synergistaceae bacterium]|jgi:NAD(P)-dependent dehydrogenase (short-subunit alcohol dehydrogenase family)|nr:SDR family oxidoreductase [Synergistaceae bacterium]